MPSLTPDEALENLKRISLEFNELVDQRGPTNEADTRAKLIDNILRDVCGWPERDIRREEHVERGYIDYSLYVQQRPYVAVEAKREGQSFILPQSQPHRTLKLSGALLTDPNISEAVRQVRGYCDDAGIRYAVATNGYTWIAFRAIREDMPWRNGNARVFVDLKQIETKFTDFWNLLSHAAILSGSLDEEFGSRSRTPRQLLRVVDKLFNSDLPLQRNRLHAQLHPLIQTVFENIADQDPLEILQSCYVHTESLRIVAHDLNTVITDAIPEFLLQQGAEPIQQTPTSAGPFDDAISLAIRSHGGQMYLLLGGIGSGKTTFLKRYQRTVGKPTLEGKAFWFHIDFLEAKLDPSDLESFVWKNVLDQLRGRYEDRGMVNLESRKNIKLAFKDNIEAIRQTALNHPGLTGDRYEGALSPYLEKWQSDTNDYVPRLLRVATSLRKVSVVLFIDNVDQLAPAYQAQIFLLAQRVTRIIGSITVLALREETYYTANLQRTLTAYTNRKFHIASPRFRKMIDARITFALGVLERSIGPADYIMRGGIAFDRAAIADFLKIIETSIFEQSRNIARFIEALCFGNMRSALGMFSLFMTSGATDVSKMLDIYRRSGVYFVAFHEFVKSIMLGERRYYKESFSSVMNLFDCGADRNASHFTSFRLLHALMRRRGESTVEGQGYVDIAELVSTSEDIFDNREDVLRALNRLVAWQLVEANTRSTESIGGASHVRVTSAGWYYVTFLAKSFSYLDLALQDTPLNDPGVEEKLRELVGQVDNLSDREEQKLARVQVRFERVRTFVEYLRSEEEREFAEFDLGRRGGPWGALLIPQLSTSVEREIAWIDRRLKENRERFVDDLKYLGSEDEQVHAFDDPDEEEGTAASVTGQNALFGEPADQNPPSHSR